MHIIAKFKNELEKIIVKFYAFTLPQKFFKHFGGCVKFSDFRVFQDLFLGVYDLEV
jgi:hypothetical protein